MINVDNTEEESECYQCDYKATYCKLMYHKRRTHTTLSNKTQSQKYFKCDQCEFSSEFRETLSYHINPEQ